MTLRRAEGTVLASRRSYSSPALKEIARRYRLDYADTLTGFKWVSRVPGLAYGYEEALGYLVDPDKVRDKDGISAAVEFLGLMADLALSGTTFADHENAFAEKFGAYASSQISLRMTDLTEIPRIMNRIRQNPPASIGQSRVDRIDDFSDGFEEFPPGDILRIWLADGSRVILRPSGTEPKLKVYIDASSSRTEMPGRPPIVAGPTPVMCAAGPTPTGVAHTHRLWICKDASLGRAPPQSDAGDHAGVKFCRATGGQGRPANPEVCRGRRPNPRPVLHNQSLPGAALPGPACTTQSLPGGHRTTCRARVRQPTLRRGPPRSPPRRPAPGTPRTARARR